MMVDNGVIKKTLHIIADFHFKYVLLSKYVFTFFLLKLIIFVD